MSSSNLKFINSLIMAVAPGSDNLEGLDFQQLTSYLSDKIGISVKLKYCKDYSEAMTML
jgi:ABC-type phosphate/phosphonate transport system substrate-binding protein